MIHCTFAYDHVITVDANAGTNTLACLKSNRLPCKTLEYVQSTVKIVTTHSVVIEICDSQINLSKLLNFTDFTELTIKGGENSTNIICNTSNVGLSFINVTSLRLDHIQISDCGASHSFSILCGQPTKTYNTIEMSALYIFHCKDVNVSHCTVWGSRGTGISIVNTYGDVSIEHTDVRGSYFMNNKSMFGGSGLHIAFSSSMNQCSIDQHSIITSDATTYSIDNCNFTSNIADISTRNPHPTSFIVMGGGASIHFEQEATNILINISKSIFKDNYSKLIGGGLFVLNFNSTTHNNQVILSHTHFVNNTAQEGGGIMGYGARKISLISCEIC